MNECVRLTNRPSRIEPCFHPSHFANRPTKANAELVDADFSLAPLPRFRQLLNTISLLFGGGIHRKSGRATPVMTSTFENVSDGSRYFCQGNAYGFRMLIQEGWSLELDYGGPFQLTL